MYVCPESRSDGLNAVMDTYDTTKKAKGVTMTTITNGSGASNTFMMAHKALRPVNYSRPVGYKITTGNFPSNDSGWVWTYQSDWSDNPNYLDHMRYADGYGNGSSRGKGYQQDDNNMDENHFGGPHPGASPVLYCDGSVHSYSYGYTDASTISSATYPAGYTGETALFQIMFAYNRSQVVSPP